MECGPRMCAANFSRARAWLQSHFLSCAKQRYFERHSGKTFLIFSPRGRALVRKNPSDFLVLAAKSLVSSLSGKKGRSGLERYSCCAVNCRRPQRMWPAIAVPTFGGEGSPSECYELQEALRPRVTNLARGVRAAALVLQMCEVACQECVAPGEDHAVNNEGARQILRI